MTNDWTPASDWDRVAAHRMHIPRVALWLCGLYLLVYIGFVALAAFAPAVMAATPLAGLPVSLLYGLALIALAFILAALYLRLVR